MNADNFKSGILSSLYSIIIVRINLLILIDCLFSLICLRLIMTTQSNQTDSGSTNPFLQLISRDTINFSSTNLRRLNLTPSEVQFSSGTISNADQLAIQHLKKLFLDYQRSGGTKVSMDIKLYRILPLFCNVRFIFILAFLNFKSI